VAWLVAVRRNDGAPGVDKFTLGAVEEYGVDRFLAEIETELRERRYRPLPARQVLIPKPGQPGQARPLAIASVRDRVVQAVVKIVLEPVFEADFLPCSFGFRPKRSTHDPCKSSLTSRGEAGGGWSRRTSPTVSRRSRKTG
jgi:RNA-directed DNA polymerase